MPARLSSAAHEVFPIGGKELAKLYPDLKCDACRRRLSGSLDETWVKVGCGCFCAECQAESRHLTHPSACRIS